MNLSYHAQQLSLGFFEPAEPVHHFAEVDSEGRGAVFTRREVVEFILDLTGYAVDRPLHTFRRLERSVGEGGLMTCPGRYLVWSVCNHPEETVSLSVWPRPHGHPEGRSGEVHERP